MGVITASWGGQDGHCGRRDGQCGHRPPAALATFGSWGCSTSALPSISKSFTESMGPNSRSLPVSTQQRVKEVWVSQRKDRN